MFMPNLPSLLTPGTQVSEQNWIVKNRFSKLLQHGTVSYTIHCAFFYLPFFLPLIFLDHCLLTINNQATFIHNFVKILYYYTTVSNLYLLLFFLYFFKVFIKYLSFSSKTRTVLLHFYKTSSPLSFASCFVSENSKFLYFLNRPTCRFACFPFPPCFLRFFYLSSSFRVSFTFWGYCTNIDLRILKTTPNFRNI